MQNRHLLNVSMLAGKDFIAMSIEKKGKYVPLTLDFLQVDGMSKSPASVIFSCGSTIPPFSTLNPAMGIVNIFNQCFTGNREFLCLCQFLKCQFLFLVYYFNGIRDFLYLCQILECQLFFF